MSLRRILILAGVLTLALLIVVLGLQAGLAPRPRASAAPGTPRLWWPTPSGDPGRAGGPSNPLLTTIPFQTTQTAAARLALGLPTPTAIGAAFGLPGLTPSPTAFAGQIKTPAPLEPSATADPLACLPPGAAADPGGDILPVSWIIDGNSFIVDRQGGFQTVRLIGVDAPPITARKLEELVGRQIVRLIPDPNGADTDAYGRLLRYVLTLDGSFINLELLRQGQARLEDTDAFACQEPFALAEKFAQTAEIGVWGVQEVAQLPTQTRLPTPTGPLTPVVLQLTSTAGAQNTNTPAPSATGATPTPTTSGTPGPTATGATATTGVTTTPGAPTATPSGYGETDGQVAIINIFFKGTVSKNESDEYIEIKNTSSSPAVLTGWSLWSDETYAERYFPDFTLQPGQTCRVYTNEVHPDSCAGISFDSDTEAWANEAGCAGLYDPDEEWMAGYCYPPDNWQE